MNGETSNGRDRDISHPRNQNDDYTTGTETASKSISQIDGKIVEGDAEYRGEYVMNPSKHQIESAAEEKTSTRNGVGRGEGEASHEHERINHPQHEVDGINRNNSSTDGLDTSSLELYGRYEELSILSFSFERMMKTKRGSIVDINLASDSFITSGSHKELVFIKGTSGVGKTTLAKSMHEAVDEMENGLFVEGKFDLMISNEPYSGVAKAFGTICQQLLSSKKESIAAVCRMIANELHHEMEILFPLVPELKTIVDKYSSSLTRNSTSPSSDHGGSLEDGQERWKYAFRLLSRVLNAAYSPLVLFLDDLHWADASSLQVVDYLVSDLQNTNQLMIIGCYRPEEVFRTGPLIKRIQSLEEKQEKYSFHITEIELHPCEEETVKEMIMTMMSINGGKETEELAEICYRQTAGNPFFVVQFMLMLENESLLSYDSEQSRWTWDMYQIERQIRHTSGVVDLLQGRMKKMPEDVQFLLQYAACLGASFALPTIDIIWKDHQIDHGAGTSDTVSMLQAMLDEKFIEEYGIAGYRWVHDRVQEAAMSLTGNVAASASVKCKVGKALLSALDEERLEDELFDVVDLVNRGNVATRPELAVLNLRAAFKARSLSAYVEAAKYVEFGAAMLPRDHWTFHRELTLDLYTLGAETEIALGNNRAAAAYCNAVFKRDDCTIMEKMPFRLAVIRKLSGGNADLKKTAVKMSLDTLRELGFKFAWGKGLIRVQAILSLRKSMKSLKNRLKTKTLDASLGQMTDPRHLAIVQLLERVAYLSYALELIFLSTQANCHIVEMTIAHGTSYVSSFGIANVGILSWVILKEDFSTVAACAESALTLLNCVPRLKEGHTMWATFGFCLCWKEDLAATSRQFEYAYHSCRRNGDLEPAMWALGIYQILIPFLLGTPLERLLQAFPRLVAYMEEHHQYEQAMSMKMLWQGFLNLTTGSGRSTKLEGSVYSARDHPRNKGFLQGIQHFMVGELHFSSSYESAADRSIKLGNRFEKVVPAFILGMTETFHRGVALYSMARKTKKWKYRKRAVKIRKKIKQWVQYGSPNLEHCDLLLDAEHAALKVKRYDSEHDVKRTIMYQAADELYQKAIESASRLGHLQHMAVCNERYANFLFHYGWDKPGWKQRLTESARLYEEWGAVGKVKELKLKLQKL